MLKIGKGFELPLEAVTQTFAILAKRGVGKTYTGAVLVEEMLEQRQQVVVVDPVGVWWGLRSSASGAQAGYGIVVFGGEHADVPLEEHSGEVIAGAIIENGLSAILDLSLLRKGAQVRFMTAFAEALYRLNRKPLHLAVDEADAFCPQRPMSDEARLLGAFEDIVRRGRARGIGITLITQRAAVINKNVLTQCEVLVCLRTIAPQDRHAIEAWIEVHGSQAQRDEMMGHLASLPVGTAYFWSPGWLDIFRKVEVRKRRTFDSSRTPKVGETKVAPKQVAEVDLAKLGEQIRSTVERAKANDPAEMRRRIGLLEKEIYRLQQIGTVISEPAIKEVSVLRDVDRERITDLFNRVTDLKGGLEAKTADLKHYAEVCGKAVIEVRADVAEVLNTISKFTPPPQRLTALGPPRAATPTVLRRPASPLSPTQPANGAVHEGLTGTQAKILDTVAMLNRRGLEPDREMIARWLSIHPNGGRYGSDLAALRASGLLVGCQLSPAVKTTGFVDTGIEGLKRVLEGTQVKIIEVLESGAVFTRELLADALGIHANGGRYGSDLARLRTMGVIPERGEIRLLESASL